MVQPAAASTSSMPLRYRRRPRRNIGVQLAGDEDERHRAVGVGGPVLAVVDRERDRERRRAHMGEPHPARERVVEPAGDAVAAARLDRDMRCAPELHHLRRREAAEERPLVVGALEPGVVRREVDDSRRVAVAVGEPEVDLVQDGLDRGLAHGPGTIERRSLPPFGCRWRPEPAVA